MSEALERAAKESRAKYMAGTPEKYPKAELRGFTILEAEALLAEVARLSEYATGETRGWAREQDRSHAFEKRLSETQRSLRAAEAALAAARAREQRLRRVLHEIAWDAPPGRSDIRHFARAALAAEAAAEPDKRPASSDGMGRTPQGGRATQDPEIGASPAAAEKSCGCGWPERDCAIRAWGNKPEENLHLECAERDA